MQKTRNTIGAWLIVTALALGAAGFFLWHRETDNDLLSADRILNDKPTNRTPALAAWAVGGLLFLSGVVVLATTSTDGSSRS